MNSLIVMNLLGNNSNEDFLKIIMKVNKIHNKFKLVIFIQNKCTRDDFQKNKLINVDPNDYILYVYKEESAFYLSKEKNEESNLNSILKEFKIKNLYICGIYLENEIFSTIMDGIKFRYAIFLIKELVLSKNPDKETKALEYIMKLGTRLINLSDIN